MHGALAGMVRQCFVAKNLNGAVPGEGEEGFKKTGDHLELRLSYIQISSRRVAPLSGVPPKTHKESL